MAGTENKWKRHAEVLEDSIKECYEELHQIWQDCGYDDGMCEQRRNTVVTHVKNLLNEMIKEENGLKDLLIAKLEAALKEITSLSKELRCDIPTAVFENLPLKEMEKALRSTVEHHRLIKQDRQNTLLALQEKEKQLCESLGIDTFPVKNHLPTEEELEEFRLHLNHKQEEKVQLENIFERKRLEIIKLAKEMEWTPSLQFEKSIVYNDGAFVFSQANMEELENLCRRLNADLKDRETMMVELRVKLTELWDRLSQPIEYRNKFLLSVPGCGLSAVNKIKNEISRLEEIKRQNVKKFIEYAKTNLEEWWVRCHFSAEQKDQFIPFHSNCYTEDLLELLELEIRNVKQFYESNLAIFDLVQQRQDLWDKMLDVENRTHDKNRLFANRGGQLLQEERERKQIQKELPKIEAILLKRLKAYEREHNQPFLLDGEVLSEVIGNQWKEHQANKEQQMKARKMMRDQESVYESKYGARSISKDSTGKRKRCETQASTPRSSKHARVVSDKKTPSSVSRSRKALRPQEDPARIKKAVRKSLRLGGVPVQPGTSGSEEVLARELSIASTALSYTGFKGQLDLESECRSSVKPGVVFATPAKPSRWALTPRNFDTIAVSASRPHAPHPRTPRVQGRTPATTPKVKPPVFL